VYFVDGDNGGLYRYTAGDGVQPVLTETPTVSLAADADGNLYLGRATSIVKYDPEEETETELVTGLGSAPVDVAVSESGELFYATADGTIRRKGTLDWEPTTVATGIEGLIAIAVRTLPRMPGGASAVRGRPPRAQHTSLRRPRRRTEPNPNPRTHRRTQPNPNPRTHGRAQCVG
jgi:hypothetical protein